MAIGPSTDGTEAVAADLAALDTDLVVVDNPTGQNANSPQPGDSRPGRLQWSCESTATAQLSGGYIEQAVTTLRRTGASNVGGMQVPGRHDSIRTRGCCRYIVLDGHGWSVVPHGRRRS